MRAAALSTNPSRFFFQTNKTVPYFHPFYLDHFTTLLSLMALVRTCQNFRRYAFSVTYDGARSLGFSHQGHNEDCITKEGSDHRALRSVEGRIRSALTCLVNSSSNNSDSENKDMQDSNNYENFQVSSRTGTHW